MPMDFLKLDGFSSIAFTCSSSASPFTSALTCSSSIAASLLHL